MLRRLFRAVFTLVGALVGYGVFMLVKLILDLPDVRQKIHVEFTGIWSIAVPIIFAFIFGFILFKLAPFFTRKSRKVTANIENDLKSVSGRDLVAGTGGLIAGLLIAFLISSIYDGIKIDYVPTLLRVFTYLILGYLGVVIATRKGSDILPNFRGGEETKKPLSAVGGKKVKGRERTDSPPKILDTSVIIDGRIADIMKTGFLEGPIVIPEFVLLELQHVSDSSDSLKRNRGRRGLDVLNKIRDEYGIDIYNTTGEKAIEEIPEVDIKLLKLAQMIKGKVVTNDYNLNKVAGVKGVEVLNINELANTLKPVVLPGEEMTLSLVKEGKENNQAVAYLDDGTMIVVEDGKKFIGKTIKTTVTSVLQTSAGRMIFAKPAGRK